MQISRPNRMNATCNGVRRPSGTRSCKIRSARSADALSGTMPSRRVTRCTCVSTGIASRPSAKLNTTARFHWLVAPASTIVQPSEVHTGLCDDPQACLDELFERLVG